ncbi:hypothetical protein JRO89_XS01G0249100 [Xanthoceras sorbifolium]|uniref:Uncharacterized protein n=1 Tax=Xanthoceras sorbifolium TaxID=99658 RepID=A0ABQ8IMR6_9ROSI|nr:hypothetical protein JRO89_XS01G0249100 [Xanthoceras sorbifolium]
MADISSNGNHGVTLTVKDEAIQNPACSSSKPKEDSGFFIPFTQKIIAEVLGTYFLIFAGCASVVVNSDYEKVVTLPGISMVWGLAVMVLVYSVGHISGAHFNPAVTIAFATCKRFPWKQVPAYIVAQVLGSTLAAGTLRLLFNGKQDHFVGTLPAGSDTQSLVIEFIITFYLMFIISGVGTDNRATGELAGITVGSTVLLNVMFAGPISGASMNPARSLGPAIVSKQYKGIWIYMVAPILGAVCGAWVYNMLRKESSTLLTLEVKWKVEKGEKLANKDKMAEISRNGNHGVTLTVKDEAIQNPACSSSKPKEDSGFSIPFTQKIIAEVLGTYFLIFAGCASVVVNSDYEKVVTLPGISIVWGLAVMVLVYSVGHISGAHFNPAVTIAFATCKRFPWKQVPAYVVAQVLGSTLAAGTLRLLFDGKQDHFVGTLPAGSDTQSFVIEFIVTFYLMFIISGVGTDNRATGELAGITVGSTVLLNVMFAGPISGASMNPARSLGPAIVSKQYKGIWIYMVAPILGAVCGAWVYNLLRYTDKPLREITKTASFLKSAGRA